MSQTLVFMAAGCLHQACDGFGRLRTPPTLKYCDRFGRRLPRQCGLARNFYDVSFGIACDVKPAGNMSLPRRQQDLVARFVATLIEQQRKAS
jgi:hypothetical protein